MEITRRDWMTGLLAIATLATASSSLHAQVGYPPPAPGQAPSGFGDPTRQHFDTLRQQEQERRSFDTFQRSQQRETERNLETLRRQQAEQRRNLDALRREGRDADAARTAPHRQVQGRRRAPSEDERRRIDRAARSPRSSDSPSILIEDPPRRRRRRRTRP